MIFDLRDGDLCILMIVEDVRSRRGPRVTDFVWELTSIVLLLRVPLEGVLNDFGYSKMYEKAFSQRRRSPARTGFVVNKPRPWSLLCLMVTGSLYVA